MVALVTKRILLGFLTLVFVSVIIFLGVEALPGDIAEAILGQSATPETVVALRRELGLDEPAYLRYLEWLGNVLSGDLGVSLANELRISDIVAPRFANSIFLAGVTALVAVPLALTLGILTAMFRNSVFDRVTTTTTLVTISTPEFFLGYILIVALSVKFNIFPSMARIAPDASFGDRVYSIVLPCLTLTLVVVAHMMRMTRAAILNILSSPFIEMAQLKGLTNRRIILFHALPNALSPIIAVVVLNLAYLVVGVVVVEVVFVYPGLGQLLVDSVSKRDVPVVQACCLIFAGAYVILNMTADVLSTLANPRLRRAG